MEFIKMKNEEDFSEFIGQIVDIFEDYLDEKGISLKSEDRSEALDEIQEALENGEITELEAQEEAAGLAIIYGDLYDVIGNAVWFARESFASETYLDANALKANFVNEVLGSYREVLRQGECMGDLSKEDWKELQEKVFATATNWGMGEEPEKGEMEEER